MSAEEFAGLQAFAEEVRRFSAAARATNERLDRMQQRQRPQTTLSEIDRMPPGCAVTLTLEGIKQGFDFQGRITGKVVGWRNGKVKVLKDGLLRPQWYAPSIWRPLPSEAQVMADWLEERGHTEAAKDFRAHWCP